jgi:hypothetical protein
MKKPFSGFSLTVPEMSHSFGPSNLQNPQQTTLDQPKAGKLCQNNKYFKKRGRGRTNLTWEEFVKRDLKDWCITKELALDRREWKLTIHMSEP